MTENNTDAAQSILGIDVMPQLPNTPDGQRIQATRTSAESLATVGPRWVLLDPRTYKGYGPKSAKDDPM